MWPTKADSPCTQTSKIYLDHKGQQINFDGKQFYLLNVYPFFLMFLEYYPYEQYKDKNYFKQDRKIEIVFK